MKFFALSLSLVLITVAAWPQTPSQPSDDRSESAHHHQADSTCPLNPTNNVLPVRDGNTFADSPLYRSTSGLNIGLGVPTTGYDGSVPALLSLIRGILEIHNNGAAQAIDLYVHSDAGFRSPYINFYKSRGTQLAPTPVTYTGVYEADSVGGMNFGGWDGSAYGIGAAVYTNNDENWTPSAHGAHLSIYGTFSGELTQNQIMQFGGKDPNGVGSPQGSVISYRPLSFRCNTASCPSIYYTLNPPALHVRTADDSADAPLSASSLTLSGGSAPAGPGFVSMGTTTVAALPPAADNLGQIIKVSDSTAIATEGQACAAGGTDTALAFSNGSVWKCF
jgi:hypothetical protein